MKTINNKKGNQWVIDLLSNQKVIETEQKSNKTAADSVDIFVKKMKMDRNVGTFPLKMR